jgi:hypothetical protein
MNLREAILNHDDLPRELVAVPEWGVSVYVRTLSGTERDAFEEGSLVKRGKSKEVSLRNIRARLVALAVVDADGKRIFADSDVAALGAKSGKAIDRLFDVASRLSGISESDVDELAGN